VFKLSSLTTLPLEVISDNHHQPLKSSPNLVTFLRAREAMRAQASSGSPVVERNSSVSGKACDLAWGVGGI
jgi:hypothetical protein